MASLFSSIRLSWRVQLGLIAVGYALVLMLWGGNIYMRHAWAVTHPEEDNASGGMYAFSDSVSDFLGACALMIPTVFLIRLMSKFETVYTAYSRFLFLLGTTLPLLLAVCVASPKLFANPLMIRFMASPFIFVGMAFSRWTARFDRAKKLMLWALVIEGVGLGVSVVVFFAGVL